jgi:hypothetical protein
MHSKNNRLKIQEKQSKCISGKDIGWRDIHKNPAFYAYMHTKRINMHKCMTGGGQYTKQATCPADHGSNGQN